MARPSFEKKQGEPPAALHLNLKQSQYDTLEQLAYDTSTSKANIVRTALDFYFASGSNACTVNYSQRYGD